MNKERKQPTTLFAVVSFLAIIAVLIIMINLGCNTTLSVFAGVIVAVITTKLLNIPWSEVEQNIIKTAAECMPTFLIVIMVGMLVGIWDGRWNRSIIDVLWYASDFTEDLSASSLCPLCPNE